ncbi:MAG: LON peptidase substrate-binding domain-containing protein [Bauldia sp.]|nr:LON peptidase substrate-binding domain-containing protein [Bauldia sp.]MCW5718260.1 LON peptidase substrate-binding domain-containing protein [Bauldia sp.]
MAIRTRRSPTALPDVIPVFPLEGALLLPRGQIPLNVFEPRYLAMVDDALAGRRIIGVIQPEEDADGESPQLRSVGCAGRITGFSETDDGRYLITLTGVVRFRVLEEVPTRTAYRVCRVTADPFRSDFDVAGEADVDREQLLGAFRAYLAAHDLEADWDSVARASNESLVNGMAMLSPYGPAEKQALLEAPDLKTRAETLVALTEVTLAREAGGRGALQ